MPDDSNPQNASSLDELSQAFAKAMGRHAGADASAPVAPAEPTPPDDVCEQDIPVSPETILEAILFVGHPENRPTPVESVSQLLRGVEVDEVHSLVEHLNDRYETGGFPFRIARVGNGYLMQLQSSYEHIRERFYGRIRRARLSQLAIDVLAVVAYNQPVTREEIDQLLNLGQNTGRILRQLVRRELLQRRISENAPRRKEYVTTDRFLSLFNLGQLGDLPQSDDPQ